MQSFAEFQPTSDSSEGAGSSAAGERAVDREGEAEIAVDAGEMVVEETVESPPGVEASHNKKVARVAKRAGRAVLKATINFSDGLNREMFRHVPDKYRPQHLRRSIPVTSIPPAKEETTEISSAEEPGPTALSGEEPLEKPLDAPEGAASDSEPEPEPEIEDEETAPEDLSDDAEPEPDLHEDDGERLPEELSDTPESPSDDSEPEPEPDGQDDETDEEIPTAILSAAEGTGITADTLRTIHNVLQNADWADTLDFLRAAQEDEQLRDHLRRRHGVELEAPTAEHTLADMSLKKVLEIAPDQWAAERARRMQERAHESKVMLEKYAEFIPAELPLLPGTEVPHDLFMPDDPEGAYGVWRRLKIQEYEKRVRVRDGEDTAEVEAVRAEIKRIGGPLPGLRRVSKWILAFKILQTEKEESKAAGSDLNYGALGLGFKRLDHIAHSLKKYDERAKDVRRALSRKNRSTYTKDGQGTARRHLAETIITIRQEELAHEKGQLDPVIPRRPKGSQAEPDEHGSVEMVT